VWIVENVAKLAVGLLEKVFRAEKSLKQNNEGLNPDEVNKFITLSILIQSRVKQSQILTSYYEQNV
jgi:hypothetical protein